MADDTPAGSENNGAADAQPAPRLQILTQYVRDLSFENIAMQKSLNVEGTPETRVQVNVEPVQRAEDRFEVALKLKVDSKVKESEVFILELDYAGLFTIQNVPKEQMHPLLMIECPRLIFPYVRRIVGDLTRDGGYPPLNIDQIDFLALYRANVAQMQKAQAEKESAAGQA